MDQNRAANTRKLSQAFAASAPNVSTLLSRYLAWHMSSHADSTKQMCWVPGCPEARRSNSAGAVANIFDPQTTPRRYHTTQYLIESVYLVGNHEHCGQVRTESPMFSDATRKYGHIDMQALSNHHLDINSKTKIHTDLFNHRRRVVKRASENKIMIKRHQIIF
jgi:hypothetical protein